MNAGWRGEGGRGRWMAEINMVPFIDIVLVLLVIFMMTAPLMVRGIDVNLPASAVNTLRTEERIVLTVNRNEAVFLDGKRIGIGELERVLKRRKEGNPEVSVYLRSDRKVPYGTIVTVMDQVKRAGIDKMGMVTEPVRDSSER